MAARVAERAGGAWQRAALLPNAMLPFGVESSTTEEPLAITDDAGSRDREIEPSWTAGRCRGGLPIQLRAPGSGADVTQLTNLHAFYVIGQADRFPLSGSPNGSGIYRAAREEAIVT